MNMPKAQKNDGKYFEKKSHQIISKLNPDMQVLPNVRITGKLSKSSRQLDVVMKDPNAYDFIAFECKDEKGNIGTPTVEGYVTKLRDVGAKHGAIVSNTDYSAGAKNMAKELGIDLLNLIDTEDDKIKTKLIATTVLVQSRALEWSADFESQLPVQARFMLHNLGSQIIRRPGKKNSSIIEVANELWNELADGEYAEIPGTYEIEEDAVTVNIEHSLISLPALKFTFKVDYEYRYGVMDITQTQGMFNVKEQSLQSQHLAVGPFGDEIFKSWKVISKEQKEAIQPSTVLHTRTDLMQSKPINRR